MKAHVLPIKFSDGSLFLRGPSPSRTEKAFSYFSSFSLHTHSSGQDPKSQHPGDLGWTMHEVGELCAQAQFCPLHSHSCLVSPQVSLKGTQVSSFVIGDSILTSQDHKKKMTKASLSGLAEYTMHIMFSV